ncbi:HAD family phosphatase [Luedemannella helvata]|uniref:HAD family phosphatase n=1 Tax=Luedemannella helvata TaxID=349315 RepID=A0ABN2K9M7_9ACTN
MTSPGPSAVLFDMDGTLIDSERLWGIALGELARRYGGRLSDRARLAMIGTSEAETFRLLHEDLGQPWRDPRSGARWVATRVAELFANELTWQPGARELLTEVRAAGVPTALVTSTGRSLVDVALRTLDPTNFDVVVTADDVTARKPDPTPYLTAAAALGVDPTGCVAIEDSPVGIASALAAGCTVIAVPQEVAVTATGERLHLHDGLVDVRLATLRGLVAPAAARQ